MNDFGETTTCAFGVAVICFPISAIYGHLLLAYNLRVFGTRQRLRANENNHSPNRLITIRRLRSMNVLERL